MTIYGPLTDVDVIPPDPGVVNNSGCRYAITYSIGGPDASKFTIADEAEGGAITFMDHTPDYETQKEYSIMVVATDSNTLEPNRTPMKGEYAVTIEVVNVEEPGEVTLSQKQVQVGVEVTASLEDPDGDVSGTMWQWFSQMESTGNR